MNTRTVFAAAALASSALFVLGCGGERGAGDGMVGVVDEADDSDNGLTENSLTVNSLTTNSLSVNSLSVNSLLMGVLATDAASLSVLKYIVSCALPAGTPFNLTVNGTNYAYSGQVGIAPGWGLQGGSCDATCQGLVSSCVIARINAAGHVVPISVRGAGAGESQAELQTYTEADAVFYGNIFSIPQQRYACMPSGGELVRTCGQGVDPSTCTAITYMGACSSVCSNPASDGSWGSCVDGSNNAYTPISIYLQPGWPIP